MPILGALVSALVLALVCGCPVTAGAAAPARADRERARPVGSVPGAGRSVAGIAPIGFGPAPGSRTVRTGPEWAPPVVPPRVTARFDPPGLPWQAGHRGIDLGAQPGTTVRAAGAGRVTFAAGLAGRGVVVVDHGSVRTTYEPVAATVIVGQSVRAGEPVGTVAPGSGHCGTGGCLHLGLRRGPEYLDPMLLLRPTRAKLRPW